MRSTVPALILAAALCVSGVRLVHAEEGAGPLTGYAFAQWTVNDGIPLGPVYSIVQDAKGYLWLGTDAGAVRFDGARFTQAQVLYPDAPTGVALALHRSKDDAVWVGTDGNQKDVAVYALKDGGVLVTDVGRAPRGKTTYLFSDRSGAVWAVSSGNLYRLRDGRWDAFAGGPLPAGEVVSVGERGNGELWIATRNGLFTWDRERDTFALLERGIIREFSEGRDGAVWVTDAGRAARRLDATQRPAVLEGLGNRLLHDRRGNVWVGTTGKGLWRIRDAARRDPAVEQATSQTGLSSDVIEALFEDREGNIWVGTAQGLHSLTPQMLTPLSAGAYVRTVLADADGKVWAGTANGLVRFRRRADTWVLEREGPTGIDILRLSRDAGGRLRMVTNDDRTIQGPAIAPLAARSDRSGTPSPNRLYDGRAVALEYRDAIGNRFAALEGGALAIERADGSRAVVTPQGKPAGPNAAIDAIYEDSRGTVWVGGTRGLCRVSGTALVCLQNDDGLREWRVLAMTESDEELWLVVDRGPAYVGRRAALVRVQASNLLSDARHVEHTIYDVGQGLGGAALGTSIVRASDGTLWVVSGGSLTVVDPRSLSARSTVQIPATPARIEGASVDGAPSVTPTPHLVLAAGARRVQIDYTALRLTLPRQLRFHYRLEGFDSDWIEAGTRRQAYYTNLAPGDYTFRVAASGEGNTWTQEDVWEFTVQPRFYQSIWFYSIAALGLAIVGWAAWRTRLWFLRRQFTATIAERTRLSREIHDTMLQSLAGIALQCQAIASRRGLPGTTEQELLALRREVEQHIREARQAVMDLRSPLLEKRGLAGALDEVGRRLVNGRAIALEIATPGFHPDDVTPDVEGELLRIGQEAISNAIRHGSATRIRVDLRHESGGVRLRISDNGRGFDVQSALSDVAGHYGVVGMRERAARLGGEFELTSSPQRGTLVDVHIPAAATPLAT